MSTWGANGFAYIWNPRCGAPSVNFVDIPEGEEIVSSCAQIESNIWFGVLGVSAAAFAGTCLALKSPWGWFALLPLLVALLVLTWPFFAVREFRSNVVNFETSGLSKTEWSAVTNTNAAAQSRADATKEAGWVVAFGLLTIASAAGAFVLSKWS